MKKYLVLIFFFGLVSQITFAQKGNDLPKTLSKDETNSFIFEKTFEVSGVSKKELYQRVKLWVNGNLKTVDNNISFDETNNSNISTSTGLALVTPKGLYAQPYTVFKVSFDFKDDKFRVKASQFVYVYKAHTAPFETIEGGGFNKKWVAKYKDEIYEDFDQRFAALLSSLEKASNKKDAW